MEPELGADDHKSIEQAASILAAAGWLQGTTLTQALGEWVSLVTQVELGYQPSLDEYLDDLIYRDAIDQTWPLVTDRVRAAYADQLAATDERYRAATQEDEATLSRYFRPGDGWWWRRRPKHAVGQLAQDLTRME